MDSIMMPAFEPTVDALKVHFAQSQKTLQATLSRFVKIPHVTARAWEEDNFRATILCDG